MQQNPYRAARTRWKFVQPRHLDAVIGRPGDGFSHPRFFRAKHLREGDKKAENKKCIRNFSHRNGGIIRINEF
ncbi:MAG: hypothetical protein A2992_00060 [Elusimicrobia bacterium RIFCSPLOWO2_01_FULL_59_12]|nr:MAG: hypothetical protein A2992_00060 [Elusimicrobia bacterium RIFCSPLOWO2_01_FULL_59_12]